MSTLNYMFCVNLVERNGEFESNVKRFVRAEDLASATAYIFESGLPAYYCDESLGERDLYNTNMFLYWGGELAVIFKSIEQVESFDVVTAEKAAELGWIKFI